MQRMNRLAAYLDTPRQPKQKRAIADFAVCFDRWRDEALCDQRAHQLARTHVARRFRRAWWAAIVARVRESDPSLSPPDAISLARQLLARRGRRVSLEQLRRAVRDHPHADPFMSVPFLGVRSVIYTITTLAQDFDLVPEIGTAWFGVFANALTKAPARLPARPHRRPRGRPARVSKN